MTELVQRVERVIVGHGLLADGDVALVGVSGGLDSMALLDIMHTLSAKHDWKLVVAHLNHQLRGRDADLDEQFVLKNAVRLGLRCEVAREDVKQLAKRRKFSNEMAARQVRHDFLARTARALGIGRIFLAHHADDQVELFFLRLMRGSGTQGLGGMDFCAPSPAAPQINLLRPLLTTWKSELRAFVEAKRVGFREDATNDSIDIPRNRIRHKVLPALRKDWQPGIDRAVLRSMELMRDEGDFVTHEAIRWLESPAARPPFEQLHVALQRRVMQVELLANGIVPQFDHVEMLRARANDWLSVDPALLVRRTARGRIERRAVSAPKPGPGELMVDLAIDCLESANYGDLKLKWRFIDSGRLPRRAPRTEFFDANKVGGRIVLRHWRPGDRFQPIGMSTPIKLQDWFVNQKIPRECRHKLVLATTMSGEVFWVEGLRTGENFKVTRATRCLLEWRWRRQETQVAAPEGEC